MVAFRERFERSFKRASRFREEENFKVILIFLTLRLCLVKSQLVCLWPVGIFVFTMFILNLYELALRSPSRGVVSYYYYYLYFCYYFDYSSNLVTTEKEMYRYSESLVSKTVN